MNISFCTLMLENVDLHPPRQRHHCCFRGNQWKKIESSGKHVCSAAGLGPQHSQHMPQYPVPTADLRATTSCEQGYCPFRMYMHSQDLQSNGSEAAEENSWC